MHISEYMNEISLDIGKYIECFKALSDQTRLRIFYILCKVNKEIAVCELIDATAESQCNVSRHLKVLKYAGLIKEKRQGRWVLYSVNYDEIGLMPGLADTILAMCSSLLQEDIRRTKARLKKRIKGKIVFCLPECPTDVSDE